MGGIEQKVEKVENLMNLGKYKDAVPIILDLFKQEEKNVSIPINIYDKFLKALSKISEEEKDYKIKFKIYITSFKYLKKKDKDELSSKIIDLFIDKSSTEIEKKKKLIDDLDEPELKYDMMKLLDNKIIEENSILPPTDIESIDKNISIFKDIYPRLQMKSSKKSIHNKIIDNYIKKSQKINENIMTLKDTYKINEQLEFLDKVSKSLKGECSDKDEINDAEALNYIQSLYTQGFSYLLMIEGIDLMNEQKFEDAYEKFSSIKEENERNEFQIEKKEIDCIKSIGKYYEDIENYVKALEYYKKNKKFKENEIRVEILSYFKSAKKCLDTKNYEEALNDFIKMYKVKKKISKTQLIEKIFNDCVEPFLTALTLYCKEAWDEKDSNNIARYEKKIQEIYNELNDEIIKKYLKEASNFISEIKEKRKENILNIKIMNQKTINHSLPEMNQRIYIKILLDHLFSKNDTSIRINILNIIIQYYKEGLYISKDDLTELRKLFDLTKSNENKKLLKIISELYCILSKNGIEFEKNTLIIIGNTIISLLKEKNKKDINKKEESYTDKEFNEILINLFKSMDILIKEKDYQLNNVEKIYNLVLKANINNKELLEILLNGYYYFSEKKLIFSNKTIDNLLTILLEKEENSKLFGMIYTAIKNNKDSYNDCIPKFFKLIFKYDQQEENILKLINSFDIPYNILNNMEFKKAIDKYINKDTYYDSIFLIINKLSISDRTSKMIEKLTLYEESIENQINEENNAKKNLFQETNKIQMRLKRYKDLIESKINLNIGQLRDIEDNLNIRGIFDLLIRLLENQNELIDKVNINLLSQYFTKERYEHFIRIISIKHIIWTEKSLFTIIRGFSKNDEEEKKAIVKLLDIISKYQTLPKKIQSNLEFEKNFEKVNSMKNIEKMKLKELLDKFKEIKYFSTKYYNSINKLIISFEHSSDTNKNIIYKTIFELLKSTSFNVSPEILEICLKNIPFDYFSKNYSEILSNMKIKPFLKKVVFDKINDILKNDNEKKKLEVIKEIKFFIDWEMISSETAKYLYNNLVINNDVNYNEISKEIIFVLGIKYSLYKEDTISKKFLKEIQKQKLYNLIYKKFPPELNKKYFIYIYSLIIYFENNINEDIDYINYPRQILLDKIKDKLKTDNEKKNFESNFNYFEQFHEFEKFSPRRDKIIRKLFFNKRSDVTKIGEILIEKSNLKNRIESTSGDKINGKLFGYGTIYYTNGARYTGNFLNDKKDGEGVYFQNESSIGQRQKWREGKLLEEN